MKKTIMNPYLPLWEYIPDGEPRIFDERLYIYGSHDYAGGEKGFCPGDYVVWSAPLSDLEDWKCHGVAWRRTDDPDLTEKDAMAAPDVVRGPDGRYYLYYNDNFQLHCRVAVSIRPEGPFQPYGLVQNADGTPFCEYKMFDPGVLVDDDNQVYLFTGFSLPDTASETIKKMKLLVPSHSMGFRLNRDMLTIEEGPIKVIPGSRDAVGTGFEGHGFYEASSPRKINGKYVMVYSTEQSHELAYALSDKPLGPYMYEDILISNGDFGYQDNKIQKMPYGNNHGGLVQLNDNWYIFYHRQTHGIECCRQGCAEKLPLKPNGWFSQAEITSCGLNKEALPAEGIYNACYCCHLTAPQIRTERLTIRECRRETEPHIYEEVNGCCEEEYLHYIANIQPETVVGYKYFDFKEPSRIDLTLRGIGNVIICMIMDDPQDTPVVEQVCTLTKNEWQTFSISLPKVKGIHALYFQFVPEFAIQFKDFKFQI